MNVSGDDIAWDLIRLAMSSTAVFAIFPMQDVLCLDYDCRMNTPSVSNGNWQFRFELAHLQEKTSASLRYLTELFNRLPQKEENIEEENKEELPEEENTEEENTEKAPEVETPQKVSEEAYGHTKRQKRKKR